MVLGAKARAILAGKYHVDFADIRELAHPVTAFAGVAEAALAVVVRIDHVVPKGLIEMVSVDTQRCASQSGPTSAEEVVRLDAAVGLDDHDPSEPSAHGGHPSARAEHAGDNLVEEPYSKNIETVLLPAVEHDDQPRRVGGRVLGDRVTRRRVVVGGLGQKKVDDAGR